MIMHDQYIDPVMWTFGIAYLRVNLDCTTELLLGLQIVSQSPIIQTITVRTADATQFNKKQHVTDRKRIKICE